MSDRRLSDLVSVGVLTRTFPPTLVDEVVAGCGRTEQRNRSLPARSMAYFSIGMALHSEGSYEDVLALLTDGLSWTSGEEPIVLPSKSAIFQARSRLGPEPLQMLFAKVATPLAEQADTGGVVGWASAGRHRRDVSRRGRHPRQRRLLRASRGHQGRAGCVPPSPSRGRGRVRQPMRCSTRVSGSTRQRRTRWRVS